MATTHTTVIDLSQLHLAEQPTGAQVILASNGTFLVADSSGTVYQSQNSGPDLVASGAFFNVSGVYTLNGLIVGHIYRWVRGTNDEDTANNGAEVVVNEMPTGGSVFFQAVATSINFFSVTPFSSANLSVYDVTGTGGGINTPPVFLYCNSRIVAYGLAGTDTTTPVALAKWTDYGNRPADQGMDPAPLPALVSNGTLTVPCRGDDGLIEFEDSGTLLPGNYRLTVESGNVGQPDQDFNGFVVEITLDAVVLEETLLKGQSGFNVRGFDQFDFAVTTPLVGDFLLSFLWTNAYSNLAMGVERQLAIYSYSLRRVATELFRVDISTTGTTPVLAQLNPNDYTTGTTAGGWLVSINSYGTLATFAHESQVYSANDTITSSTPLSGVLTGLTAERMEDIIFPVQEVVLVDGGSFTYPPLGVLSPTFGPTYQVDQSVVISIPQPSGTAIYSYVWQFWDGTTEATTGTSVSKVVNIGGVPTNGSLSFSVTPVAIDGQAKTVYGAINANNVPVIVPAPQISTNDEYVPFQTQLSLYSFDFENDTPLTFEWVNPATMGVLSATGTSLGTMTVSGTWTGNGTVIVNNYTAHGNSYTAYVTTGQTIRCYVIDSNAGTNFIDFDLRGYISPPPASGIAASANFSFTDSSALPVARVGAGQQFIFEVDARDLTGAPLIFQWNFAGSNNWTVPSYGNGTTTLQPDGSYQSVYEKDLSGEIIVSGTSKVAVAACVVTNGNSSSEVDINVVLLKNNPPSSITVVARDNITQIVYADLSAIPAGSVIQLEAMAVDVDDDLVTFEWFIALTGTPDQIGTAFPLSYDVRGGKVIVNTAGSATGLQITGTVVATDRAGGTVSLNLPPMTLV